jgi:hypothetical protein
MALTTPYFYILKQPIMKKQLTDMFQFRKALSGRFLVHFYYGYTEINGWHNDNMAIVDIDNIEVVLNRIYNDYKTTIIINKKEYKTPFGFTKALGKIDFTNKKFRRL